MESFIAKSKGSVIKKMTPPNYLYGKDTYRSAERNGINYNLDISNAMEHHIYFDLEQNERNNLLQLLKKDDVVIDVGVNVGETLLTFAKCCSEGFVYGFEPDSANLKKALKNISLNKFDNIRLENLGLGNETATLKLYKVNTKNSGMNRVLTQEPNQEFDYEEINIITLDDYVNTKQLSRLNLLKIDVEGFEYNVLLGGAATIKKYHPVLFIELDDNNLKENGYTAVSLVNLLKEYGYKKIINANDLKPIEQIDLAGCHLDIIGIH